MEARLGGENPYFFVGGPSELNGLGKKSLEWDLNDWRWDGELFRASRVNSSTAACQSKQLLPGAANGHASNTSTSCSDDSNAGRFANGNDGEAEKRRRDVEDADEPYHGDGSLALRLGGTSCPALNADPAVFEGKNGKRLKAQGNNQSRSVCQVEDCGADLSSCKDYHRRHKVCEFHAKASMAMVGNAMQRFCQQCSRFHLLQEFDEGKRSCRRRLAGHNRRRRKAHPDPSNTGNLLDNQAGASLLISLLRILSNVQSGNSGLSKDQEFFSHILKNLATAAGSYDAKRLCELLETSQDTHKESTFAEKSSKELTVHTDPVQGPIVRLCSSAERDSKAVVEGSVGEKSNTKNFDLNDTYYDDLKDGDGCEKSATPPDGGSGWAVLDPHQSSPPQTAGNSETTSSQSQCNSNGDVQSRTDKIVFKLFGKDPSDFPCILRSQILDWLSNSPTDMESYIRPGCVVLTIFLRLTESSWEKLANDLSSSLHKILSMPGDDFWRRGWLYARIQHQAAFVFNGQVILDIPLLYKTSEYCKIHCISPIAVSPSTRVSFTVKGFNLTPPTTSLLCAFEGKYLLQDITQALHRSTDYESEPHGLQTLSFSASIPNALGRGFVEVEDTCLSSCFFPFIVAEDDVCTEVRLLENSFTVVPSDENFDGKAESIGSARKRALDFLHEMGWLLRRSQLRSMHENEDSYTCTFSLMRFRWLLAYAIEWEWCAVIKKLLDILFEGIVDLDGDSPAEVARSEHLLHTAARRNSRALVEFLLRYMPPRGCWIKDAPNPLFRPDLIGPLGITPLHIAAATMNSENILDALTNDPNLFGIKAWKSSRDSTGLTPKDYAHCRGYDTYIQSIQKKIDKQMDNAQVVLSIPAACVAPDADSKQGQSPAKLNGFEIGRNKWPSSCKSCSQQLTRHPVGSQLFLYRPAMLSLVGIAAVCVCVGLLLKSAPTVGFLQHPFRWEALDFGTI